MDRLTYYEGGKARLKIGDVECSGSWVDRLAAYEDTGLEPEQVQDMMTDWVVWKEAEAGDRLIVLPCKVGDTVWRVYPNKIVESRISMLQQKSDGTWKVRLSDHWGVHDENIDEIGKTIFLSRKEAEAALGGDGDG